MTVPLLSWMKLTNLNLPIADGPMTDNVLARELNATDRRLRIKNITIRVKDDTGQCWLKCLLKMVDGQGLLDTGKQASFHRCV